MKDFIFDNHWDVIKAQLQQRYAQLTDDDVALVAGQGEEMLARLRLKIGISESHLQSELNELYTQQAGVLHQAKAKAGELVDELKAKASAVGSDAKEHASEAYEEARKQARTFQANGEDYVRRNPRQSLLAALCAGFVAGLIIRR